MTFQRFLFCTSIGLLVASCASAAANWPKVQPFHEMFHFANVDQASAEITLRSAKGEPLYSLDCHSGSFDSSDFDYSGLLACRLVSLYSKERVSTLLTETVNQTSDWENRGRFLVKHLLPGCASYPDWGRSRTFYLRGMKLVLSIDKETFNRSSTGKRLLESYSFDVIVQPDPSAVSSIARKTNVPEPPWFYGNKPCRKNK